MGKLIISEKEALESYRNGKTVYFGNDVMNAWFDTDGYSFDEKNGIDTSKTMQYAVMQ